MAESEKNWTPWIVIGALAIGGVWWWNAQADDRQPSHAAPDSCQEVFDAALSQERAGDTAGSIGEKIDWLNSSCPEEYDALVGYISSKGSIAQFGADACDVWVDRVGEAATALLRADQLCSASAAASAQAPSDGSISWDQAIAHVGESQYVCGPLASIRGSDDDVFLNLGRDYPDVARFTIVLWDVGGVESIPSGTEVCTSGTITNYDGAAQIELNDVSAVKVRAD
ncbi:hypothetical protein JOF42_000792 [Microbacterium phyllosphaerae]|uniref:Secreted protein n=1 Tax=Microbacterium phyllosphaerae TaxID=124798 RepID=A0ABS4WM75_9MICO|nr:hypothetical protein [Microbacterium phyllosphaerae]MBP2377297.1 hypothetical protein [Microbacterium phyllosphaerae]